MNSTRTFAAIASAVAALGGPLAHAASFNDSFVLSTQGQNPWGVAKDALAWRYDSGFLGTQWGSYNGTAPVSFGLNAVVGSANQHVPGTGGQIQNPLWEIWNALPVRIDPAPPRFIDNPVPYATIDTRSGFDLGVKTSGQLGISVYADASAGAVAMNLPFSAKLDLPTEAGQFDQFKIRGTAVLGNTATMNVQAPYIKTGINAHVHTRSQLGITGCVIGAGCSSSGSQTINEDFDFNAVDFDTRRAQPLRVIGAPVNTPFFDKPFPIVTHKGSIGEITLGLPKDLNGGQITRGHANYGSTDAIVTLKGADLVAKLDYDVIALALLAVPTPPLDFTLDAGAASIEGTAVQETAGIEYRFNQSFSFHAGASVRLEFDRNITSEYSEAGQTRRLGRFVTIDLYPEEGWNDHMNYYFEDGPGRLLSYEYMIDDQSRLYADTTLSIDGVLAAKAGCFRFQAPGASLVRDCAFNRSKTIASLSDLPYWSADAAIGGFNSVTVAVPEPSGYAMLLLGLGAIGAVMRRRVAA